MQLLSNFVKRVKKQEAKISFYEQLVDKTWLKIDEEKNILRQLEFLRNKTLIDAAFGKISRKAWELTGSGKLIISDKGSETLFTASIVNGVQLSLNFSGTIHHPELLFEEGFVLKTIEDLLSQNTTEEDVENINVEILESENLYSDQRPSHSETKQKSDIEKQRETIRYIMDLYFRDEEFKRLAVKPPSLDMLKSNLDFCFKFAPKEISTKEVESQKTQTRKMISRIDSLENEALRIDDSGKLYGFFLELRNLHYSKTHLKKFLEFLETKCGVQT
ncbi:hypothetical protein [Algoriphagus marinus]|uniref:hypothetical protein n=1 Tax=Algoriphagus marinus TaxID=1925762 RepID=UPI00094BC677|nr:hypothetical protein [Algoriphagus marinus]